MIKIQINGEISQVEAGSLADLLSRRGLTAARVAIERNGSIVPRSRHAEVRLEDGDTLEIVVAVGGG